MVSDRELKVFYGGERRLFRRLVIYYGVEPPLAVLTIALWLFLENLGHPNVIHFVLNSDDNGLVASLVIEAQRILDLLRDPTSSTITKSVEWTAGLLKRVFTMEEFVGRRSETILWINDTVANGLSRASKDLYEMPAIALGYLTGMVPLTPEEARIDPIRSCQNGRTKLFQHAIGCPFPWTSLSGDLMKPFVQPSLFNGGSSKNQEMRRIGLDRTEPAGFHNMNSVASPNRSSVPTMVDPFHYTSSGYGQQGYSGRRSSPSSMQPMIQSPTGSTRFIPYPHEALLNPYHGMIHQVPYPLPQVQLPNLSPSPFPTFPGGAVYERQEMDPFDASAYYSSEQFDDDSDSGTEGSESDAVGDGRTLFITFSRGYPLEAQELRDYFSSTYGDVVERVMLQKTKGTRPLFAKLFLTSSEVLAAVLNGEKKVKLVIQGRDAWARVYKRKRRSQPRSIVRREMLRHA